MRAVYRSCVLAFLLACGGSPREPGERSFETTSKLALAGAAAPAPADPFDGVPPPPAGSACHPLASEHCQLPYPSNWFSVRDSASPTGMVLRVPDGIVRDAVTSALPPAYRVGALLNGQEGFPVSGPILFEVDREPAPESIVDDQPLAAGEASSAAVAVFDLTTGERVPIYAETSAYATSLADGRHVLQIFPRSRFAFGHHYVAVLTDRLRPKDPGRGPYAPPRLWSDDSPAAIAARAYHEPLLRFLEARAFDRSRVLAVTDFTTRTEADATRRMYRLFRTAYAQDHPVRDLHAWPSVFPGVNAIVTGEVRVSDFRGADGDIDDRELVGREDWLPFMLTLPESASRTPSPVAIYGHPLIGDHHLLAFVASLNARHGYATISIDAPNHGVRSFRDGGHVATLRDPSKLGRVLGMMAEGPVDNVSLLRAVRTSLADLDIAPRDVLGHTGDGKPDLDVTKVIFEGLSMGGVVGSGFIGGASATGLGLAGSFLEVSGAGMVNILAHSSLWSEWFHDLIPRQADGADALFYLAVAGQRIELADGLTVAHRIDHPLTLTYGLDDAIVTDRSALALAELARVPLLRPALRPEDAPFLATVGADHPPYRPLDGAGILQLRIRRSGVVPLDFETHVTFVDPRTNEVRRGFLGQIITSEGDVAEPPPRPR